MIITAGQDLPLVVTARNSGERAGREVVQVSLGDWTTTLAARSLHG